MMKLHVSGPINTPGDPYCERVVTFALTKDGKRTVCSVNADELEIPGTRFYILRILIHSIRDM
jgi:hypothetical protein